MKKTILFTAVVFLAMNTLSAQYSIGLTTGINHTNVHFSESTQLSSEAETHYFVGLSPGLNLGSNFSVNLNILYSVKGVSIHQPEEVLDARYRFNLIDFYPELKYQVLDHLSLFMGFYYGLFIDQNRKFSGENKWTDLSDQGILTKNDFGLTAGLEGEWNNLFIFLRYTHGLQDVWKVTITDAHGQDIPGERYLRNFQLGIGYRLDLGKS